MTREEKILAIRRDFLERDQQTFVRIRQSGRLGWESLIPEGGNYSDIIRDTSSQKDIIQQAYDMARDYIIAMDTPYKVTLRLSPKENYTDSKVVYLATAVFDDNDLSAGQQIDTFIGLAIHEGCHLKWTDFKMLPQETNMVVRDLMNVIEDERIERECGETMPGYANYLKSAKYYMFDLYGKKMIEKNPGNSLPAHVRLFNAIIALIRFPKMLQKTDIDTFTDELYQVRERLTVFPSSPEEVKGAARDIYEIIKRWFEKNNLPNQQNGKSEKDKKGSGRQSDEMSREDIEKAISELSKEEREQFQEKIEEGLEQLRKAIQDINELTGDPTKGQRPMENSDIAECVKKNEYQVAGICEDVILLGETAQSVLYKVPEDKYTYNESLQRVKKYIPAIARPLRNQCTDTRVVYHGMRSGILDTGKLAEAYQGVQTVYKKEGTVKSDNMAVCVLVDESGSMYGKKIQAARDVAVLLNEAVSNIPAIDLYIYGHTYANHCREAYTHGEHIAELQLYREKSYHPKYVLGSISALSGNLDSVALQEAATRMRKQSNYKKNLMFVITDGCPNEKREMLTKTVRHLEKEGMNILAVCIEPGYNPSEFYTHHVTLTDMETLSIDLGKMIKKTLMQHSNRHCE